MEKVILQEETTDTRFFALQKINANSPHLTAWLLARYGIWKFFSRNNYTMMSYATFATKEEAIMQARIEDPNVPFFEMVDDLRSIQTHYDLDVIQNPGKYGYDEIYSEEL